MAVCVNCCRQVLTERPHLSATNCLNAAESELRTTRTELEAAKARIGRMARAQMDRSEEANTMLASEQVRAEKAEAALIEARWALAKVFSFVPETYKTGWTDEVQESIDEALRDERE